MSGSLALALAGAARTLADKSPTARFDAELLASHLLGLERGEMLLRLRDLDAPDGLQALVERRAAGEPVQYITGRAEFWSLPIIVTPDVLIPRPDSETLIEAAEAHFQGSTPPARILDLGTGSGALLAAALTLFPRAAGLGIDISVGAANVATRNMIALDLAGRADILVGDWGQEGWQNQLNGRFDLVLCNPPYIAGDDPDLASDVRAYEPHGALFAEQGGLEHYRILFAQLRDILCPSGIAVFEIGHRQGDDVMTLARQFGLIAALHHDLAGQQRAVQIEIAPPAEK